MVLSNYLQAEAKKQRHSLFFYISLSVPVLFAVILALYVKGRQELFMVDTIYLWFFKAVSMGTPLVSSLLVGILVQQEAAAGNFKNVLSLGTSKAKAIISKLIFMLGWYAISLTIAVSIYYLLIKATTNYEFVLYPFIYFTLIYCLCAIFQYFLTCFIAFRFGAGPASLFGLAGVIITALSMTGLGEGVWVLLPWAWSHRIMSTLYGTIFKTSQLVSDDQSTIILIGMASMILMTASLLAIFYRWANRWEGQTSE